MTLLQAIILGIVQGLTEFMPISSSAHLIIIPWLFHWEDPGLSFDVALHLGTLIAILWHFAPDWVHLVRAGITSVIERKVGSEPDRRLFWLLVIGTVPGIIAGVIFENNIEELFHKPDATHSPAAMTGMAVVIAFLGIALFLSERIARHERNVSQVSLKDTILIGLAQSLAIFPGVSRSGSTITAGLALGLQREASARFSFLLAVPIVVGAGFKSIINVFIGLRSGEIVPAELLFFGAGFVAAAVSGYFCIRFLLRYLRSNSTDIFVYYRWLLAGVILVVVFLRQ